MAGYDDLGRLVSANCGSAAGQTFSHDAFGNSDKSGSPFAFQPTYSFSTNQMTSVSGCTPTYDSNGNATNDCNNTYTWDADGNSITVGSVGLTFDAFDRMVEQDRSGTYTQIVYAPNGAKLALMNGQSLVKAFIPLPGQAAAVYTNSGLDHYQHSDWLGSVRLTSSPSQTYTGSIAYAPFGETYASGGTPDPSFTGMNPDTVSTDYDFLMREYSIEGRWPSPDPAGLAAVNPANPQSWNRYAYVYNNPMTFVDPLGLDCKNTSSGGISCTVTLYAEPPEINITDIPGFCSQYYRDGFLISSSTGCSPLGGRLFIERFLPGDRGPGGGQGPQPPKPTPPPSVQKIADEAQCEKLARDRADERSAKIAIHSISSPARGALIGLIGGAVTGCVITVEGGCFEGVVPGATAGLFGGFLEGSVKAIYSDISGTINTLKQLNQDIAACRSKYGG